MTLKGLSHSLEMVCGKSLDDFVVPESERFLGDFFMFFAMSAFGTIPEWFPKYSHNRFCLNYIDTALLKCFYRSYCVHTHVH